MSPKPFNIGAWTGVSGGSEAELAPSEDKPVGEPSRSRCTSVSISGRRALPVSMHLGLDALRLE